LGDVDNDDAQSDSSDDESCSVDNDDAQSDSSDDESCSVDNDDAQTESVAHESTQSSSQQNQKTMQCLKWTVAQSPNATNILFGRPKAAPN
jgi:hypothetical protein